MYVSYFYHKSMNWTLCSANECIIWACQEMFDEHDSVYFNSNEFCPRNNRQTINEENSGSE